MRQFTLIEIILVLVILLIGATCLGIGAPVQFVLLLLFGWALFLYRVAGTLTLNVAGAITALVCATLLTFVLARLIAAHAVSLSTRNQTGGRPRRWALAAMAIVVLLFVAGIAIIGVTHQTAWLITSRESVIDQRSFHDAVRRMESSNCLRETGLAEQNYDDSQHSLTPGALFDAQGKALHGWQTLLLPYLQEEPRHETVDLNLPWDHPANAAYFKRVVRSFCYHYTGTEPATDAHGYGLSHYAANAAVLGRETPLSLKEISDAQRLATTILAGEAAGDYKPWGHPINWRDPALGINQESGGFGNTRGKFAQFVFCDGSVRSLTNNVSKEVLQALSTPNAGDKVTVPDD